MRNFRMTDCGKTRGVVSLSICVFGAAILMLTAAISAQGASDLLLMPSVKSSRAPHSNLMDVARAGRRLVAVGERGHILYSDDECNSWHQAEVPVSVTLTAVCFPTDLKGWAVGHDGVVLHTEDGGNTWIKQLDGAKINELVHAQIKRMITAKTDFLENEKAALSQEERKGLEIELENLEFFLEDAEMALEEGPARPLMDVWFKNEKQGIIIGAFGMILGTTDGGGTWQPLLSSIDNADGFHYYGIIRSGDDLFIAGEVGGLYRSADFGRSWQRLASPYEGSFFGITGDPSGGVVVAFGLQGNIFYSLDRGATWHPSKSAIRAAVSGGTFMSDGTICLVAVDGSILKSTDRGKTFTPLPERFPGGIGLIEIKRGVVQVVGLMGTTQLDINTSSSKIKDNRK